MNEEKILEVLKKSVAVSPILRINEESPMFIEYADGSGKFITGIVLMNGGKSERDDISIK